MGKFVDLTGQRFGRLVVIGQAIDEDSLRKESKQHTKFWLCQCDCGKTKIVSSAHLKDGHTKSCGCWHDENARLATRTHGMAKTRLHAVWNTMKQRCNNPNNTKYKNYGGRGIKVCDEWKDFIPFYNWAINNGYDEQAEFGECTIDRIDVNGDYCPENCRWVNIDVQMQNMTINRILEYKGEKHTLSEWGRILGKKGKLFKSRIDAGWSVEEAMEIPYYHSRRKANVNE